MTPPDGADRHQGLPSRGEFALALSLIGVGLAILALFLLHHAVNTDEPQHLHVAWAWSTGQLPYRDVFDNHAPLFSLVGAPIISRLGERPDIVVRMRLAMIPWVALALWATWVIGRRLFSPRAALWAVALGGTNPSFLRASVEYRPDGLWMAIWLWVLAALLVGRPTATRSFAGGLLLGAAFAASLKTSMLLLALLGAGATTMALARHRGTRAPMRWLGARAAAALCGLAIVPALFAGYFAARGAWRPLLDCTVRHNLVSGLGLWRTEPYRPLLLPLGVPLLWLAAGRWLDRAPDPGSGRRRAFLFLTAGFYCLVLEGFWPLVTRQDALPFIPMASVLVAPLLVELAPRAGKARAAERPAPPGPWTHPLHLAPRTRPRGRSPGTQPLGLVPWTPSPGRTPLSPALRWAPALVAGVQALAAPMIYPAWRDQTKSEAAFLAEALALSRPGDCVMDMKGETVFRRRPYYYALETITQARIREGSIQDDIPERLVATRTAVAVADNGVLPDRARAFMNANYVQVGWLRVVGQRLEPSGDDTGSPQPFLVRVPQRYAVVVEHGPPRGRLDGTAYDGPRDLAQGWHSYRGRPGEGRTAFLWAAALERGFSPLPRAAGTR